MMFVTLTQEIWQFWVFVIFSVWIECVDDGATVEFDVESTESVGQAVLGQLDFRQKTSFEIFQRQTGVGRLSVEENIDEVTFLVFVMKINN